MHELMFNIFPHGGLDSSVITTVWVGIAVIAFFNLRLGWVASGIVVPGYVVPLLILKPWSGAVIFLEAFTTYFFVWSLSEVFSRLGRWSNLFGRDRFFALLTVSILVRITFDAWLLPYLGEYLNQTYHLAFDYQNNLHSFGLIIISLIANQLWKPGFFKGIFPLAVVTGVTYLIVRFIIMEYTNFTMSNLGYLYEDIAVSILASPKAYIVLLTTAFIAARMNLRYGWEFNGILIPSLVSLLWYNPWKIVSTFLESFVILIFSVLVLKTPFFKAMSVEGMRKVLLFFNISYLYKFALSYFILWNMPGQKITDFWGFGYILPTLLAIKMHDTERVAITTRVTLQTSLVSVLLASIAGFALTFFPGFLPARVSEQAGQELSLQKVQGKGLVEKIRDEKVPLYRGRRTMSFTAPAHAETKAFTAGLRAIRKYIEGGNESDLDMALGHFNAIRYRVSRVEERYLVLSESADYRGWGIYVLDLQPVKGPLVEIPAPLDEWGSLEAGTWLFKAMKGRAMAIAGTSRSVNADRSSDVLGNYNTLFNLFHQEFAGWNVLQVRTFTAETARVLSGSRPGAGAIEIPEMPSMLWVKDSLPPGLNLPVLKDLIGSLRVEWGKTPFANLQRETMSSGFAELILDKKDAKKIMARSAASAYGLQVKVTEQRIDGYLQDWLLKSKGEIADKGTQLFRRPQLEELLYLDEEVLTPLVRLVKHEYHSGAFTQKGAEELHTLGISASVLGYRIIQYRHKTTGQDYLILAEAADSEKRRYWGSFVIRLGGGKGFIVQIPRPVFEVNSFEYGVALFEKIRADALLIGGAHPLVNTDGSGDLVRAENKMNAFNLANQVLLREHGEMPMMIIQSRAFGISPGIPFPRTDVLLSFSNGAANRSALSAPGRQITDILESEGFSTKFVDGSPETAGYEAGGIQQGLYLNQTVNKEFMILWLSPAARKSFAQKTEDTWQEMQFRSLNIPTIEADLVEHISRSRPGNTSSLAPSVRETIRKYSVSHDILILKQLKDSSDIFTMRRVIDINSKQAFLFVSSRDGHLLMVSNLDPKAASKTLVLRPGRQAASVISDFINSRAGTLELRSGS